MRVLYALALLIAATAVACGGSDKDGSFLSKAAQGGGGSPSGNPSIDATITAAALTVVAANGGPGNGGINPPAVQTLVAGSKTGGGGAPNIPQGNSAAAPDPCTLLTLDDAMTVLKSKDLQKQKDTSAPNNPMGSRQCDYASNGSNFSSISLTVISTAGMAPQMRQSGYSAKKQFDELKRLTKDAVTVKGIGDDAWLNGARFIHVLKKDVTFDILVFMDGDATEVLKAAATRVAAKLP